MTLTGSYTNHDPILAVMMIQRPRAYLPTAQGQYYIPQLLNFNHRPAKTRLFQTPARELTRSEATTSLVLVMQSFPNYPICGL